ncbi:MAG: hypothetical protein E7621_00620 [Ruminococcaceae bacterium]|nr:hypothetical protein [Oscillospiraceae bacterium]
MAHMTYKMVQNKETLEKDGKDILFINISYPSFESEKRNTVTEKLNDFYKKGAEEFEKYCKTKLFSSPGMQNINFKCSALMHTYIPYIDDKYMSVITSASFFDGKEKRKERFTDNWLLNEKYPQPLKASRIFPTNRKAKKLYADEICSKIMTSDGGFSYFPDAVFKAKRLFDENRFYLTARGVAFYYDEDVLFPAKEGIPSYVIGLNEMEGIV